MTTASGKHPQDITHAEIAYSVHKLLTSAKDLDDLSIGFDLDCGTRQQDLTKNENLRGKYHVRIMLKDVFGSKRHRGKATYGLVYKLSLLSRTTRLS